MKNHLFKLTLFVVLVLGIYLSPFKIIVVSGNSMYPTLKNKQILIGMEANKFDKEDVVVAYFEDNYIIKRVKFLEGDEYYYWLNNNSILPILVNKDFYDHFNKHNKVEMVYKSKIEKNREHFFTYSFSKMIDETIEDLKKKEFSLIDSYKDII